MFRYKIVSVTGTKGKTSVVRMLDYLFIKKGLETLRVDSDGHYRNGKQKMTFAESVKFYWLFPTLAPGRFLYEFQNLKKGNGVAVFETSIGCSRACGTAYNSHHIGVFTNVFEDHLDDKKLKTPKDILKRKASFILDIYNDGAFVYNYDDLLLRSLRNRIKRKKLDLVAVSLDQDENYLRKTLKKEKIIITVKDGKIIQLGDREENNIVLLHLNKFKDVPIKYKPFLYNVLFVLGAALSYGLLVKDLEALYDYKFSRKGGRMTLFKVKDKFVLLDYAHEKYSLKSLADYVENTGKYTLGILRLDYKRTFKLVKDTGSFLADSFDEIFVYDKVDGKKMTEGRYRSELRKVGEISSVLFSSIKEKRKKNDKLHYILEEEAAFKAAFDGAPENSVLVLIIDDLKNDLSILKKMGAERVKFTELYK